MKFKDKSYIRNYVSKEKVNTISEISVDIEILTRKAQRE